MITLKLKISSGILEKYIYIFDPLLGGLVVMAQHIALRDVVVYKSYDKF